MSNTEIRTLNDNELDLASGGYIYDGGCIPSKTISTIEPQQPGDFHSTFTRYVIGRNFPVPA